MPNWTYPPIFLQNFPKDYYNLKDTKKRNKLFIQILAPLALKLADETLRERYEIIDIQNEFKKNFIIVNKLIKTAFFMLAYASNRARGSYTI